MDAKLTAAMLGMACAPGLVDYPTAEVVPQTFMSPAWKSEPRKRKREQTARIDGHTARESLGHRGRKASKHRRR